jgi:hypothetical protein
VTNEVAFQSVLRPESGFNLMFSAYWTKDVVIEVILQSAVLADHLGLKGIELAVSAGDGFQIEVSLYLIHS